MKVDIDWFSTSKHGVGSVILILTYLAGLVFAKGWSFFFALIFPPYSMYIFIEQVLTKYGWLV